MIALVGSLMALGVQANPLQIKEARGELAKLSATRIQYRQSLNKAKRAYSRIDKAYDHQKAVVKRLEAADKAQVKAMYASARHAEYRVNPYLADTNHAQTSVRWK